jgi:Flp pilus assembly protein TadG
MSAIAVKRMRLQSEAGHTLIESAITILMFLFLLFAVVDFSYLFLVKMTLQNATRQAGRYAITGQAMTHQSRYNSVLQTVQNMSFGLATNSNTTICGASAGCNSAGGPGDTVTITVTYPYHFITPLVSTLFANGTYTVTVSSSFKNEPFPPSQT